MNIFELFLLAIGLSMDAFAVAVSIGLTIAKKSMKKALIVGLYFGIFQGVMPLIGYFAATRFAGHFTAYKHFIAFALLGFLGAKMIIGSFKKEKCADRVCTGIPCSDRSCPAGQEASFGPRNMVPLAVATSIDALAIGVSFALLDTRIVPAVLLIGVVTFFVSIGGVCIGNIFGARFKKKAEFAGGLILVLMGLRILIMYL
ncbi:MAG: manganese efflux pump MntP family protein [Defluviitaleaceae bacterium]|nr:manganese efflux pump MntP family protein [Defluviitaleaceae bacterium]